MTSRYTVHPGATAGAQFRGSLGGIEIISRTLSAAEVVSLMKSSPSPGATGSIAAIELTRAETRVWQPGSYELKLADGSTRKLEAPSTPSPLEITGPWSVSFDPKWGGPAAVSFEKLQDWAQHPEPGIRHYSSKATYRKVFSLQSSVPSHRTFLDLGDVRNVAIIRLNGRELGTLWIAPWRIEITAAVRPGANKLEVDIVNPWNNRLVGDRDLPEDKRLTFIATKAINKNAPLLPAGLLGPVRVLTAEKR